MGTIVIFIASNCSFSWSGRVCLKLSSASLLKCLVNICCVGLFSPGHRNRDSNFGIVIQLVCNAAGLCVGIIDSLFEGLAEQSRIGQQHRDDGCSESHQHLYSLLLLSIEYPAYLL